MRRNRAVTVMLVAVLIFAAAVTGGVIYVHAGGAGLPYAPDGEAFSAMSELLRGELDVSAGLAVSLRQTPIDVNIYTTEGTSAFYVLRASESMKDRVTINLRETAGGAVLAGAYEKRVVFMTYAAAALDIYLPAEFSGTLAIETASGDVIMDGGWSPESLTITTASGDIRLGAVSAPYSVITAAGDVRAEAISGGGSVRTASGDITIASLTDAYELGTTSGCIRIQTVTGSGSVNTASGDVTIAAHTGDISITTQSGDVRMLSQNGSAVLGAASGDIRLSDITGGADASTISGSIELGFLAVRRDMRLETMSGDVTLSIPDDAAVRYRSTTGDLQTDCDYTLSRDGIYTVGGGAYTVEVTTTAGDLRIR